MTDRNTLGKLPIRCFLHGSANGNDGVGFEECRNLRCLMFTGLFCWRLRRHLHLVLNDMYINEHERLSNSTFTTN